MKTENKKPNILLIMSDEHAPSVLGAYGNRHVRTPNIDRLAREGVTFTNACCNFPSCVPSRLSFLTGRSTQAIEVWSLSDTVREDSVTWPELLSIAGYDTAISGRMHLWWADKKVGFHKRLAGDTVSKTAEWCRDLWDAGDTCREPWYPEELRKAIGEKFMKYFPRTLLPNWIGVGPHNDPAEDQKATDAAVRYIRDKGTQRSDEPFALCLGLLYPHPPFQTDEAHYAPYAEMPVEVEQFDDASLPPFYVDMGKNLGYDSALTPELHRQAVRAYHGLVQYVDEFVGQVVGELEAQGLLDNTVVIFTADHGEMLGRRGWWFKYCLYEGSIGVPLIVRYPSRFPGGCRCETPVSLIDLFPTLVELAGADPYPEAEGQSLIPLLEGHEPAGMQDRIIFAEYADFGLDQPTAMVRKGDFKLIAARTYEPVLYDLKNDPDEKNDLANASEHAHVREELERELYRRWDPDETRRKVIRNQWRTEIHVRSKRAETGFS